MTLTIELHPEIERSLLAKAQARGLSLADYVSEIVAREVPSAASPAGSVEARNLVELFENSPFRGLNMTFERDKDYGREIEL